MFDAYQYEINSDVVNGDNPIEGYHILQDQQPSHYESIAEHTKAAISGVTLDAPQWLRYAADKYNISANIKDYIIVPCTIMYSDLPNRNGVGFPYEELTSWNVDVGKIAYQTWVGKPTHIEHDNRDPSRAKGVILSSSMFPMKRFEGNVWAVSLLLGFDRNRDEQLSRVIMSGERPSYSMGAFCRDYKCNICSALYSKGGCEHVKPGVPRINVIDGRLAYNQVQSFIGIECSSVSIPAYYQARNPQVMRFG